MPDLNRSAETTTADRSGPWWRRAVVYEVYIRSFADSRGDGVGDIAGLRSRLPYLSSLGVDAVWITPWYESPNADGGYDVADFRKIDERYGDLSDAEALIGDAHEHDIKVIIDLVPNHTSRQHAWFEEAVASPPGHPSRNRYEIHPGQGPNGDIPPSDWKSVFGGSAWERLPDGEWYLHLFDVSQPDLNWDNEEVRQEFLDIFRFWLDRGADGIRVDVAHGLVKDKTFPSGAKDARLLDSGAAANHPFWDRDGVHEIIRDWRKVLDSYEGDRMMVAEAWVTPERLKRYLRPDEYHQSFNFALVEAEWDAAQWRDILTRSTAAAVEVGSSPTWTLSNHDIMRPATRLGLAQPSAWREWLVDGPASALDQVAGRQRAQAAALLMLALPGSAYLYQGEELGLPEVWDLPVDVLQDPVWDRSGGTEKGRDGARVPLPWTAQGSSFGFGSNGSWLPQPDIFGLLAVDVQQREEGSALSLYELALRLRRQHVPADESLEWLELRDDVVAFRRSSGLVSVTNFGSEPVKLLGGQTILSTRPVTDHTAQGDSTVWLVADNQPG